MWLKIYDLLEESEEIRITQKASLEGSDYGLSKEPALFGSKKWWNLIGTDVLPLHLIEGVITDIYLSGHCDYPQFEVNDGKRKTQWEIFGDQSNYLLGSNIRIDYVEMEFKASADTLVDIDEKCECVIKVEICAP